MYGNWSAEKLDVEEICTRVGVLQSLMVRK